MMRRGRPILRTAAVVGTANAVSHRQAQRYARQDAEQYAQEAPPPQAAAPEVDVTAELQQIAQLHEQGILTDEEFAAKKAQLLGI